VSAKNNIKIIIVNKNPRGLNICRLTLVLATNIKAVSQNLKVINMILKMSTPVWNMVIVNSDLFVHIRNVRPAPKNINPVVSAHLFL
jgi:hypothetical protein